MGLWAEKNDVSIGTAMGLETFVGLLAIVQSWSEAVNAEVWVCNKMRLAPDTSGNVVCRLNMAID